MYPKNIRCCDPAKPSKRFPGALLSLAGTSAPVTPAGYVSDAKLPFIGNQCLIQLCVGLN